MLSRRTSYGEIESSERISPSSILKSPSQNRKKNLSNEILQKQVQGALGLQLADIVRILWDEIPRYSTDKDVVHMAQSHRKAIATRNSEPRHWSMEELEDVASLMYAFFDSAPSLPPSLVGLVHTIIGLIRYRQREYKCAIESLQKALWIKKSSHENPEEIGISLHRLGMAYSKSGNKLEACSLFEKSLASYEQAGMNKNHPFVTIAREQSCRHRSEGGRRLASARKEWRSLPTLPLSREEDTSSSMELYG